MNKVNYGRMLDETIRKLGTDGRTGDSAPSLLLHACCAPCSSYVLLYLAFHFKITVLYYNPNITEEKEYRYREAEEKRLIRAYNEKYEGTVLEGAAEGGEKTASDFPYHPIKIVDARYNPAEFLNAVKGLEAEPEGGRRCTECFGLRLKETAAVAARGGYDYFTTTLSISPLKDEQRLNTIGAACGAEYGVSYLFSDFKKKDGYKRSTELSKEYNLYRQNYCGCGFSKAERERTSRNV